MCESEVFLIEGDREEKVMEEAVKLERVGDKIRVTDVLGTTREFDGELGEISFLDHRVVIRKISAATH